MSGGLWDLILPAFRMVPAFLANTTDFLLNLMALANFMRLSLVRTEGRRSGGLRFKFYADGGARRNVLLNFQRSRWASPEADKSLV